jgi:hypothetical protein
LSIRPNDIFWMGWPVVEFMMVAMIGMAGRKASPPPPVHRPAKDCCG